MAIPPPINDFERYYREAMAAETEMLPAAAPETNDYSNLEQPLEQTYRRTSEMNPALISKIRERRKEMGKKGVRKSKGIIEVQGEDGKPVRFDTYGEAEQSGYAVARGAPRWANAILGGLQNAYSPESKAANQRGYGQRRDELERERNARRIEAQRKAELEADSQNRELSAKRRAWDTASKRYYDDIAMQKEHEFQTALERIRKAGRNQPDKLDALEQEELNWLRTLSPEDRAAYFMGRHRGGAGATEKPPMTMDQAQDYEAGLSNDLTQIEEALRIMGERQKGGWNGGLPSWLGGGPDDATYTMGKTKVTVPGSQLGDRIKDFEQRRDFYTQQRDLMRSYLQSGRWPEGQTGYSPPPRGKPTTGLPFMGQMSPEDFFGQYYSSPGRPIPTAPTGTTSAPPSTPIPTGRGPNQRSPIPSPGEVSMQTPLMQAFYQALQSNPGMTNTEAARVAVEMMRKSQAPPEPELPSTEHAGYFAGHR